MNSFSRAPGPARPRARPPGESRDTKRVLSGRCGVGPFVAGWRELHPERAGQEDSSRLAAGHTWGEERSGSMAQFSDRMVNEVVQRFWAAMARGEFITDAAAEAGTYRMKGHRWLAACGGVRPRRGRDLKGRCLTFAEREEIAVGRAGGESMRAIAARLGRSPSTISRELARNAGGRGQGYRARTAHALAYERAGRPKPSKLAVNPALRRTVQDDLQCRYSPEQIVGRLGREFPDDPQMRVSAETIYQSLDIQSRGALRRDLTKCLRTGRALRRPGRCAGQRKHR